MEWTGALGSAREREKTREKTRECEPASNLDEADASCGRCCGDEKAGAAYGGGDGDDDADACHGSAGGNGYMDASRDHGYFADDDAGERPRSGCTLRRWRRRL